jgi:ABC-type phosphate transport system substrate-binding protein
MRLPDSERSRAVLIGVGTYRHLPVLRGVHQGATALQLALTNASYGTLKPPNCEVLPENSTREDVCRTIARAASAAEDLLLVYYAGHGLIGSRREDVYLTVADTRRDEVSFAGIAYGDIRDLVLESDAAIKAVILDCCYSGRAIRRMSATDTFLDELDIEGTAVLTSVPPNQPSIILDGEDYPAYTSRLLALLHKGIPGGPELLTLPILHRHLRRALKAAGLRVPQAEMNPLLDQLGLVHNRAWQSDHKQQATIREPIRSASVLQPSPVSTEQTGRNILAGRRPEPFHHSLEKKQPPQRAYRDLSLKKTRETSHGRHGFDQLPKATAATERRPVNRMPGSIIILLCALTVALGLAAWLPKWLENTPGGPVYRSSPPPCGTGGLSGQGVDLRSNSMSELIDDYQRHCTGATIAYRSTKSSDAINALENGTADFIGLDVPPAGDDLMKVDRHCEPVDALTLPTTVSPIAVAYHVGSINNLRLRPTTLANIFSGITKSWDAPEIKSDNPELSGRLPSIPITPVHRTDETNSTTIFTAYLAANAPLVWVQRSGSVWPQELHGDGSASLDNMTRLIRETDGSIGYIEWSSAKDLNNARLESVNEFVPLTTETVNRTISAAMRTGRFPLTIDAKPREPGTYPLVRLSYAVICGKGGANPKIDQLKSFFEYLYSDAAQEKIQDRRWTPMPAEVRNTAAAAVRDL